jgi:hypothetical protein
LEKNEIHSAELHHDLAELEDIEIEHNPFDQMTEEQIKKALRLLEEYSEEF